jgi:PAS domain-containing protein
MTLRKLLPIMITIPSIINKNMASTLGYTVDEMVGKPYVSLFPESRPEADNYQELLWANAGDSVSECCL